MMFIQMRAQGLDLVGAIQRHLGAVTLELIPRGSVRGEATDSDLLVAVGRALARARSGLDHGVRRDRRAMDRRQTRAPEVSASPNLAP